MKGSQAPCAVYENLFALCSSTLYGNSCTHNFCNTNGGSPAGGSRPVIQYAEIQRREPAHSGSGSGPAEANDARGKGGTAEVGLAAEGGRGGSHRHLQC